MAYHANRSVPLLLKTLSTEVRVRRARHTAALAQDRPDQQAAAPAASKGGHGRGDRQVQAQVAAIRGRMGRDIAVCMIDSAALIAGWNVEGVVPARRVQVRACHAARHTGAHARRALRRRDGPGVPGQGRQARHRRDPAQAAGPPRQSDRHTRNASWHHAKNVRALEDEFAGRLRLVHLPPYTPELNSIELVWRMICKAIANAVYETVDDLRTRSPARCSAGTSCPRRSQDTPRPRTPSRPPTAP